MCSRSLFLSNRRKPREGTGTGKRLPYPRRNPWLLWSSFFVTLLAKKIPLFIQLFLPHEALHNYCNYADAHNYIQHMQIPLPLDKVTAPF